MSIQSIPLSLLDSHPDNPRLQLRDGIVRSIQAQLERAPYDPLHAILVRPIGDRFQIIDGHHRVDAACGAKLETIPAWVRELSDEDAFMQMALANAQTGLTPLERGKHAMHAMSNGTSLRDYVAEIGRPLTTIHYEIASYDVYRECSNIGTLMGDLQGKFHHLRVIHSADRIHWPDLVQRMLSESWTVEQTEAEAKKLRPKKTRSASSSRKRKMITAFTLTQWKAMTEAQRIEALDWRGKKFHHTFNEQKTEDIEWARWSWNPVTGCLHNCPYCYAREIAEGLYAEGFEPTLRVDRLCAPYGKNPPVEAEQDISYRNVFTDSMADLFGNWVPKEWINAVLETIRDNPQWNFLLLTKFPQRMAEFEYPDNAWLGTSVDLQARVKNAERAMRKVKASVKWLSLEPLIEPVCFDDLSLYQWIVIGGATPTEASTGKTPCWKPSRRWVHQLTAQAMNAGCRVYHKSNLNTERLREFPWGELEESVAPEIFHYLKVIP